jgi:hypothetical protein
MFKRRLPTVNENGLRVVERYAFSWPTEVEVISRAPRAGDATTTPAGEPTGGKKEKPAAPVSSIVETRELVTKAPEEVAGRIVARPDGDRLNGGRTAR